MYKFTKYMAANHYIYTVAATRNDWRAGCA